MKLTSGSTLAAGLDRNLNTEPLKIDHRGKDNQSSQEVHDVGEILSVECLLQGTGLVVPGQEKMKERNDGTLKLGPTSSVDSGGAESFPDDVFANVGSNEKRDSRTQSIALLEKLIKQNDDETGNDKLEDEQQTDTSPEIARQSVESSQHINGGLSK